MSNERLYLDIHVLQNTPPSCINRDDTGSPKTAIYGGVTRARVSSQAWKRAVRMFFRDTLSQEDRGERTKRIIQMVADAIAALDPDADSMKLAQSIFETVGVKLENKKDKKTNSNEMITKALFFLSHRQAEALANVAVLEPEKLTNKKNMEDMLNSNPSIDLALFGRMVADDAELNVDAACQVAHAISTHAVRNEFDYFTAVDDLSPEDNAGAGHIGTVEFNSSVLYRYATLNLTDLAGTLQPGEVKRAAIAFVEAFIRSMPTGKQNTFANRTLPETVYLTLRRDQPVNLAGAFEKPVYTREGGLMAPSARALKEYAQALYAKYDMPPAAEIDLGGEITGQAAGGLKAMLDQLAALLDRGVS